MRPRHLRLIGALLLITAAAAPLAAQDTDPRAPGAITLPELGRMNGELDCVTLVDERFGRQIWSVGDVDNDGIDDWILTHRRCDTSHRGYAVIELLLYHGVRNSLPDVGAGERIGPSEIATDGYFVAAGDWDDDGFRDIATILRVIDDPITNRSYRGSIVVFWNDGHGRFSVDDTTHLTAPTERLSVPGPDLEQFANIPKRSDLDGDRIDDLLIVTNARGINPGVFDGFPRLVVFRGRHRMRWGRNGHDANRDWSYSAPMFDQRASVLDHDDDGTLDIVLFGDRDPFGVAGISILYGVRGALPDTVPQFVPFARVDGQVPMASELIDLTGDRVPELIVTMCDTTVGSDGNTSFSNTTKWLVYVGRRGQRIAEQYGSGNDAPNPGDSLWWGRPWTYIWPPSYYDEDWLAPRWTIFDPGDLGMDGVDDICGFSYPRLVCYNGGARFDSKIDAMIATVIAGGVQERIVRLGTIDGSSLPTLGIPLSGGGVAFVKASRSVPKGGTPIRLPEGTNRPGSGFAAVTTPDVHLIAEPNPTRSSTKLRWTASSTPVTIVLSDMRGRELRRWLLPLGAHELAIDLSGLPRGTYLVIREASVVHTALRLIVTD